MWRRAPLSRRERESASKLACFLLPLDSTSPMNLDRAVLRCSVFSPTLVAFLAGKHCNLDLCHVKTWLKIGIYLLRLAFQFRTHVITSSQYSLPFIRILDDFEDSLFSFSRSSDICKIIVYRALISTSVIVTINVTRRRRE